jgi:hypothetical protein
MYVCMYVCLYVCMFVCMYMLCMYMLLYVRTYVCVYVYIYSFILLVFGPVGYLVVVHVMSNPNFNPSALNMPSIKCSQKGKTPLHYAAEHLQLTEIDYMSEDNYSVKLLERDLLRQDARKEIVSLLLQQDGIDDLAVDKVCTVLHNRNVYIRVSASACACFVCVCMYMCIYLCLHVCLYLCIYEYMYCTHVCIV